MTVFLLSINNPCNYSIASFVGIEFLENFKWGRASIYTIITPLLELSKSF
jgi:hypothetical protein